MNPKKGMDRIALVMSILISITIFCFFLPEQYRRADIKILNPEWKVWKEDPDKYDQERKEDLLAGRSEYDFSGLEPAKYIPAEEYPLWKAVSITALMAIISFVVTLFGIKGLTRLVIWIAKGFEDT
jgi:hypothetical protein